MCRWSQAGDELLPLFLVAPLYVDEFDQRPERVLDVDEHHAAVGSRGAGRLGFTRPEDRPPAPLPHPP